MTLTTDFSAADVYAEAPSSSFAQRLLRLGLEMLDRLAPPGGPATETELPREFFHLPPF